ncbi:hypothetical protein BDA96_08G013100 [Sorghum bicolor]|uniref:Knottin scorpion toxin-like domain-containing protein n=2 Tax=Sorghum bicolor TaxID=4558 RepID=A0A921U5P6_SORBI|nr:hypothetical protein BDA96_08G013100 [Sorghum bicolor]KXG22817.1 hypothetical protein SORBI_3008G012000 [Sorghum bicolor]
MRTSTQIIVMLRLSLALLLALSSSGLLTKEKAPEESVYKPEYYENQFTISRPYCDLGTCINFCHYARYKTGNCVTNMCICKNSP